MWFTRILILVIVKSAVAWQGSNPEHSDRNGPQSVGVNQALQGQLVKGGGGQGIFPTVSQQYYDLISDLGICWVQRLRTQLNVDHFVKSLAVFVPRFIFRWEIPLFCKFSFFVHCSDGKSQSLQLQRSLKGRFSVIFSSQLGNKQIDKSKCHLSVFVEEPCTDNC